MVDLQIALYLFITWFAYWKGHENEKERLIMEKEAVLEECASLETQLSSLRTQINGLISDVEEQRAKVTLVLDVTNL